MRKIFFALALSVAVCAFTAAQTPSQQVQITNGPVIEGVGDTWAVVAWTTNAGSSSVVRYGTDQNNLSQTAEQSYRSSNSSQGANHRVRITNLQPGTTYFFKVDSGQAQGSGTDAASNVMQFTTKAAGQTPQSGQMPANNQSLQITQQPQVARVSDTSAIVTWMTNAGGSSIVHYGTDANNLSQTAESPYASGSNQTMHRVRITGLQPGTTYYFTVDSGQGQGTGTESKSGVSTFTTKPQGQH
jgi:phosphodiesterase/alkaline phosphatase D-like protein